MKEVYCLFGVENNYDQPDHDLYCIWENKPTLDELQYILDVDFKNAKDEDVVSVVKLFNGSTIRLKNIDYRIEKIGFGTKLSLTKGL